MADNEEEKKSEPPTTNEEGPEDSDSEKKIGCFPCFFSKSKSKKIKNQLAFATKKEWKCKFCCCDCVWYQCREEEQGMKISD